MLTDWYCALCGDIGETRPYCVLPDNGPNGLISVCQICYDRVSPATTNLLYTEIDNIRSLGREFTASESLMVTILWAVAIFIRNNHEPECVDARRTSDMELFRLLEVPKHRVVNGNIIPLIEPKKVKPTRLLLEGATP